MKHLIRDLKAFFIFIVFLLSTLFSLPTVVLAQADTVQQSEDSSNIVTDILFIGNETYKSKKLLKKLDLQVGDFYDPVLADLGTFIISEYYRQKGFPDVLVNMHTEGAIEIIYEIEEGPRVKIKSVEFLGNDTFKSRDLHSAIKLRTRNWLFWPIYYTEEKVAADVERLSEIYYRNGYLNHEVKSLGRSNIIFMIDEGPQYVVGDVNILGNEFFETEALISEFELQKGQVYYPQKATKFAEDIANRYSQNGFIDARVDYRHLFNEVGSNVVDIEFVITEGRQFRIGKIEIAGNEYTQDKVYRRMLDEYNFTPGKLYNTNLSEDQGGGTLETRLQRMTMAEEVIIRDVIPENGAEDYRDARINITEGLTGSWNPGVAYSTDGGVMGQLIWTQSNFDITDKPENFKEFITMRAYKGAGQTLRIALEPGTIVSRYSIEFSDPYFRDRPTSIYVGGSKFERWYESHNQDRVKGYLEFEKRHQKGWRTSIGFRLENIEVKSLDFDAPKEIIRVRGNNLLFGTSFGIGRDLRDDVYLPTRGSRFTINYEQVTGDYDFGRLTGSKTWYRTLYEDFLERKTVLATKLLAGTTVSDAPPFEKFYAGGSSGSYSIRGFEYRGVSTRGLQTNVANPRQKDPIGSDWIFIANTELTVPLLSDSVSALFFLDSGTIDSGYYRASVGAGIQIMIPYLTGPIPMRFTFGVPLRKDDSDETQSFSFFMGTLF